jgi:hypothetical protein
LGDKELGKNFCPSCCQVGLFLVWALEKKYLSPVHHAAGVTHSRRKERKVKPEKFK